MGVRHDLWPPRLTFPLGISPSAFGLADTQVASAPTKQQMFRAGTSRVLARAASARAVTSLSKRLPRTATAGIRPLSHSNAAAAAVTARGDDSKSSWSHNAMWAGAGLLAVGSVAVFSDQVSDMYQQFARCIKAIKSRKSFEYTPKG